MADVYVDSTVGTSGNGTIGSPYKTLSEGYTAVTAGNTLYLKCGSTFAPLTSPVQNINGSKANVTITQYGTGAKPIIDGTDRSRHGLVIYDAGIKIIGIDFTRCANAIYPTGVGEALLVKDCNFYGNNYGIAANNGGYIRNVVNCIFTNGAGTGDAIQMDSDVPADSVTLIRDCHISRMGGSGVNHKRGVCTILNTVIEYCSNCGILAHVFAAELFCVGNTIRHNNHGNEGVFNVKIENDAVLTSVRNVYANPLGGSQSTQNIAFGTAGYPSEFGTPKFFSIEDRFIESAANLTCTATITAKNVLDTEHLYLFRATFDVDRTTQNVINLSGHTNAIVKAADCIWNIANNDYVDGSGASPAIPLHWIGEP